MPQLNSNTDVLDCQVSQARDCGQGSQLLYNPADGRIMTFPYLCMRWDCPTCSLLLKNEWLRHFLQKAGDGLYYFQAPSSQYRAIYQRFRREGLQFISIFHNGSTSFFTTGQFQNGIFLTGNGLVQVLSTALGSEEAPLNGKHKIRTSRNFAMKREKKGWVALRLLESSKETAEKLMEWGSELLRVEGEKFFLKASQLAITKILELTSPEPCFIYDNLTPLAKRRG